MEDLGYGSSVALALDTVVEEETRPGEARVGRCPPRHLRTGSECHMLPGILRAYRLPLLWAGLDLRLVEGWHSVAGGGDALVEVLACEQAP